MSSSPNCLGTGPGMWWALGPCLLSFLFSPRAFADMWGKSEDSLESGRVFTGLRSTPRGSDGWEMWVVGCRGAWTAAVPCLPGPALVHPECAQAGQRPALLQTLQRQPAPRHGEALGAACSPPEGPDSCRCPCVTSACGHWHLLIGLGCSSHAHNSSTLLSCCPPSRTGSGASQHWLKGMGLFGAGRGHAARYQGGPGTPYGVVRADHACQSPGRNAKDSCDSATFSPFHLPLPAQPALERHDVGTMLALPSSLSSLPRNCLDVSAFCQRFADSWGFFFLVFLVFSSCHCDTKKLRSLMKK